MGETTVVSPLENWTKVVMELNDNAINRHKNVHAGQLCSYLYQVF